MNSDSHLDKNLYEFIVTTLTHVPGLSLELVEEKNKEDQAYGFKTTSFVFRMNNSSTSLRLHITHHKNGEYSFFSSFVRSQEMHFSFNSYLRFIQSADFAAVSITKSMRLEDYLGILLKYLQKDDLKKVVSGEEWIEVPFDWESIGR